jgi:hypothetical protein
MLNAFIHFFAVEHRHQRGLGVDALEPPADNAADEQGSAPHV